MVFLFFFCSDVLPPPPPMGLGMQSQQQQQHQTLLPLAVKKSPVPPPSSFNNSHTLGLYRFHQNGTPGLGGTSALPSMKIPPPEELTLHSVPPEYRKEGPDWYAVFNPKVKKVLDVNLMHNFVHAT